MGVMVLFNGVFGGSFFFHLLNYFPLSNITFFFLFIAKKYFFSIWWFGLEKRISSDVIFSHCHFKMGQERWVVFYMMKVAY